MSIWIEAREVFAPDGVQTLPIGGDEAHLHVLQRVDVLSRIGQHEQHRHDPVLVRAHLAECALLVLVRNERLDGNDEIALLLLGGVLVRRLGAEFARGHRRAQRDARESHRHSQCASHACCHNTHLSAAA